MTSQVTEQNLIDLARTTALHSYPPYSFNLTGCVVESVDGEFITGASKEVYGEVLCAESQALMAAKGLFGLDKVSRVVLAGGYRDGAELAGEEIRGPCPKCSQHMLDIVELSGRDIEIICCNGKGSKVERHRISTLKL